MAPVEGKAGGGRGRGRRKEAGGEEGGGRRERWKEGEGEESGGGRGKDEGDVIPAKSNMWSIVTYTNACPMMINHLLGMYSSIGTQGC